MLSAHRPGEQGRAAERTRLSRAVRPAALENVGSPKYSRREVESWYMARRQGVQPAGGAEKGPGAERWHEKGPGVKTTKAR